MDFITARKNMVKNQVQPCDVTNKNILGAMLEIPKERFVPTDMKFQAYSEVAIPIANDREIIETRFLGKMINAFDPQHDEFILDIGAVYGYSTAILAKMCQAVVMLERPELTEGRENIFTDLGLDNIIVATNLVSEGFPDHAPYEGIFIQLAIDVFPEVLVQQLKIGGKVVAVFNNDGIKQCYSGLKTVNGINWKYEFDANVAYLSELRIEKGFEF